MENIMECLMESQMVSNIMAALFTMVFPQGLGLHLLYTSLQHLVLEPQWEPQDHEPVLVTEQERLDSLTWHQINTACTLGLTARQAATELPWGQECQKCD